MNELFKNDIDLDQKNHRYILAENPNFSFQSVTEFIHLFFEKFDKQRVAQKLINTNPKYSGKTIDQVIKDWSKGAERGTIVHNELEMFIKKIKILSIKCQFWEPIGLKKSKKILTILFIQK